LMATATRVLMATATRVVHNCVHTCRRIRSHRAILSGRRLESSQVRATGS
jgi:hypothetical protein